MKEYEWDPNKRLINITKHGIDFIDAIEIFSDTNRIELESDRNEEKRFQVIGMIKDIILMLVIYTHRNGKKRIISARRASKKEQKYYYDLLK